MSKKITIQRLRAKIESLPESPKIERWKGVLAGLEPPKTEEKKKRTYRKRSSEAK